MKTVKYDELLTHEADISILVATEIELVVGISKLEPDPNHLDVLKVLWGESVYYLGYIGCYTCVLTMSQMGSRGRDGSILAATRMIERWNPRALILVGIAFGKDKTTQIIGDILVSTRIHDYEPARISVTETQHRGPSPEVGLTLLNRARNLGFTWVHPETGAIRKPQFGPILSGEKLIDNDTFKQEQFSYYRDAIGGEMEAEGAYAAATRTNIEWIVVKAICDWADGTKSKESQPLAASNAFDFVNALLSEPGLNDNLPRPTTIQSEQRPRPLSAQEDILETALEKIRTTSQRREDAGNTLVTFARSFYKDGKYQISPDAQVLYDSLKASRNQAFESWLNAYEDASVRFLHGSVPFKEFIDKLGQEIIEFCEQSGPHEARLKPRETSAYQNIWQAYDKIIEYRQKKT